MSRTSQQPEAVDITPLSSARVLAALYNAASPKGYGFLQYDPTPMTVDEAQALIDERRIAGLPLRFDYLKGRALKIDLSTYLVDPRSYDRSNGHGAVDGVLFTLFAGMSENNEFIVEHHRAGTRAAAETVLRWIDGPASSSSVEAVGVAVVHLGFGEGADELRPILQRIMTDE